MEHGIDVLVLGEMGIGNTSAASALACALAHLSCADLVGNNTGLDAAARAHKLAVIERALALVDGFIVSVAALVAARINPAARPWLLFSHHSAEQGHGHVLQVLQAEALLRLACALDNDMATFAQATVSDRKSNLTTGSINA